MLNSGVKRKELRVVLSPEALERITEQARLLDQTPASFARQVVMEKVTALEAASSQSSARDIITLIKEIEERGKEK